jgi:hypothetical protein
MSTGYSRVENALQSLRARTVGEGEAARVVLGASGRLDDVVLAKDHVGQIHLLTALPEGRGAFDVPLGRTLRTEWIETFEDGATSTRLDVACTDARLLRTFMSLIGEMLDRADESGRASIDELTEVLSSWRAALAREREDLNRQRAIGLFGELTVLEILAGQDPMAALERWKGRSGHRHDFVGESALEVKTFTGTGSPSVTIHGALQLDPPAEAPLHLVAFRIVESAKGRSLADLADAIAALGVPRDRMTFLLGEDAPALQERSRRFLIEETRLHAVGQGFPGIRASRLDDQTLKGVDDLSYTLHLDACPGAMSPDLLGRVLEEL